MTPDLAWHVLQLTIAVCAGVHAAHVMTWVNLVGHRSRVFTVVGVSAASALSLISAAWFARAYLTHLHSQITWVGVFGFNAPLAVGWLVLVGVPLYYRRPIREWIVAVGDWIDRLDQEGTRADR